jgi:hypothetical protein
MTRIHNTSVIISAINANIQAITSVVYGNKKIKASRLKNG